MGFDTPYCCPHTECNRAKLSESGAGLTCAKGHFYPYESGTNIPIFYSEYEQQNEYTLENAAEIHDNSLRWVFATFKSDEDTLRNSLVSRIKIKQGDKVLVTGAGAGNDIPYVSDALGGVGEIYAQDIAKQMLLSGAERYKNIAESSDITLRFSVSDAGNLPFPDNYFDAAYHFGGINLFPDITTGIAEMDRVVKPGGRVLISDEGLAPWLTHTKYGQMLTENNYLYAYKLPLEKLPESAKDVNVSWELCNCFYVIDYEVAGNMPEINIDVPHIGKRGGSIRKRYFGKLEGIDPTLRDRIYEEAENHNKSRVEYIESLLQESLSNKK